MPPVASSPESLELVTPGGAVPLGFVEADGTVFLIAREREALWPVEILRNGVARLRLRNELVEGVVELVTDSEDRNRILRLFLAHYGAAQFARWYDHPARVLKITLGTAPGPSSDESPRYYRWLESEFDNVAPDYDRHITGNRINRLLRDRSLATLVPLFSRSTRLFEVGCGSGMETLPLLRAGHEILALDISAKMLEVVRTKARAAGVSERLSTRQVRARDLATVLHDEGRSSFEGGYSTYGALNCEPDLSQVPSTIRGLLRPGGAFVAGIYNRWCLFEIAGYALTGQLDRAGGRRRNPIPVGASRFCVDVYAYSVPEFLRLFQPGFRVLRIEGVPVLLPPSDLTEYAERFSRRFDLLARADRTLGRAWPFNRLGDHFLVTFAAESIAS